jgi:hypothetical protein
MNMNTRLMISVILGLTSLTAQASVANMVGTWNGTGTVYSLAGENQGTYAVQIVDTLQTDGSVDSNTSVAVPGSADKQVDFTFRDTAKGFSMSSPQGSGGATCFEKGLCEGYVGDSVGNGVAFTLIIDGPNNYRLLKTELQSFKATRAFLEKYTRAQTK